MDDRWTLEALVRASEHGGLTRREAVQRLGIGFGLLSTAGWLAACGSSDDDAKQRDRQEGRHAHRRRRGGRLHAHRQRGRASASTR